MVKSDYLITKNLLIAKDTYEMILEGDCSSLTTPGMFINIKMGKDSTYFLRRPISVVDYSEKSMTIIYKVAGDGTKILSEMKINDYLNCLVGLGNGFNIDKNPGKKVCLIGGGVGIPPLYRLAKDLKSSGIEVSVVLGFNSKDEEFYADEFKAIADHVFVTTVDGSMGTKGFVTNVLDQIDFDYYFSCGPEPMLMELLKLKQEGQLSFEERMGCGFGACMGCSCKTLTGYKRICVEGPVMESKEVFIDG